MKKKWIAAIIIYIALVTACLIVIYAVPSVKGMLEKTYVTEYGKIDIADEVSAYIVRDETVYVAAQDSEISRKIEPGVLIKAKTKVVELTPIVDESAAEAKEAGPDADQATAEAAAEANGEPQDNIGRKYESIIDSLNGRTVSTNNGRTQEAGYISFDVNGTEASMSTDRLDFLKRSELEELSKAKDVETPSDKCGKGEPIFKVIRNSRCYLVFYIDNDAAEKYYEGRSVSVDIDGNSVPAKVAQISTGKTSTRIALSCKYFVESFLSERSIKTTVTVASAEGLVLQDSSIVMKGDQQGVFVKNKLGEHKFKPISIKADDGERCVVYSDIYVDEGGNYVETLSTYDEIVAEPTEEEIAELQVQAREEAAEKKQKEAEEAAAQKKAEEEAAALAEREAAAKKAAEEAAKEKQKEQQAAAKKAAEEKSADAADTAAEDSGGTSEASGEQKAAN